MAREEVCRAYWPPVASYFRALGCDREDALDLTQELLAEFCDGGGLERVTPEVGSLRSYLKTTARNRLINFRRDAATKKRGSGAFHLPLEELDDSNVPADPKMADAFYDQRWAWTIFRRAMDSLAENYASRGKGPLFEALKGGLISQDSLKPYAELGATFGVGEAQIKLEVHRARKRLADTLRQEVLGTLGPNSDLAAVESELRYLLRVLAHGS
jgi:RNA polymerase sigma factor (sigma-70 family)